MISCLQWLPVCGVTDNKFFLSDSVCFLAAYLDIDKLTKQVILTQEVMQTKVSLLGKCHKHAICVFTVTPQINGKLFQ